MKIFQRCSSTVGWGIVPVESRTEPGKIYQVVISDFDYLCDCASFRFRGICRHRAIAEMNRCRWEEGNGNLCQTPEQRKAHTCPECGNKTILAAEEEDEPV